MLFPMNDGMYNPPDDPHPDDAPSGKPPEGNHDDAYTERLQHKSVGARLPEAVGRGAFATGAVVLQGPGEFIIDFVEGLAPAPRIASRVVLNPPVFRQFVAALEDNLGKYTERFGPPKELPRPDPKRRPSLQDMYDRLKLPDEQLSGVYATTAMIRHAGGEFLVDFITNFYPTAAVSSRVYFAASQAPRILETCRRALEHRENRQRGAGPDQPGPDERGSPGDGPSDESDTGPRGDPPDDPTVDGG